MRDSVSFLLAVLSLVFLGIDALTGGGALTRPSPAPDWMLPGGIACFVLSWIISMMPRN